MTKMMLIDAVHPEEVRVAVVDRGQVDDFDFESAKKRQLRGNIYLAKVTRVEPSLQAAFVDFGGNRHGFLAFSEIHPDYYQLPQQDREALLQETARSSNDDDNDDLDDDEGVKRPSNSMTKKYKIQEVIRRRQIMLVQAVKEERGTKGAALTTYLSLAGRYCVLMPNTPRGGGISRKITNASDRKRLKKIVGELEVPEGMGLIVRTAGAKRTKSELKRDFEYLIRLWSKIRELTLSSVAPCLINEEAGLVHRALRDLYDKDIEQVVVDGEAAYREAKDLAKMLMPSHAKKVQLHKSGSPVFAEHQVEQQLDNIFSPVVNLRSGGYLVIHQTEALVAIDVNSGKSTKERNIEQTALRTNLEAAEEACRQMRLRDLAGLVVIDFIDMEEGKNNRAVERRMKDCLKHDRARVQNAKISMFGLMEISRQRRRAGVLDASSEPCSHCAGTGHVRSVDSAALHLLRALESRCHGLEGGTVETKAPTEVILFLLNQKRGNITALEEGHSTQLIMNATTDMLTGEYEIIVKDADGEIVEAPKAVLPKPMAASPAPSYSDEEDETEQQPTGRRRRRRPKSEKTNENLDVIDDGSDESSGPVTLVEEEDGDEAGNRKRRRRGRRGGRRRRKEITPTIVELAEESSAIDGSTVLDGASSNVTALLGEGASVNATAIAKPVKDETPTEPKAMFGNIDGFVVESKTDDPEPSESVAVDAPASEEVVAPEPPAIVEIVEEPTEPASEETETVDKPTIVETVVEIVEEPAEPEPLPETEKPKERKRGWWQRRSAS